MQVTVGQWVSKMEGSGSMEKVVQSYVNIGVLEGVQAAWERYMASCSPRTVMVEHPPPFP